jgi:hypothetical protein
MAPNRGSIDVYVDGVGVGRISTKTPDIIWQAGKTWYTPYGTHTFKIVAVGDGYMDLDAFVTDSPTISSGKYEDNNSNIHYVGTGWTHSSGFPQASNGNVSFSKTTQDGISFAFSGSQFTYVYTQAPNRGIAAVTIDGDFAGYLDLYNPDIAWQSAATFYAIGDTRTHYVTITVTGKKNTQSSDYYVDVDRIEIP